MSSPTVKITSLNNITIGEGCTFSSDNFKNSTNNVITLPSETSTLATVASVTAVDEKADGIDGRVTALEGATSSYVTLTGEQTLTNKTLTTPEIASITNNEATLTLPSTTGTVALTSDITTATTGMVTINDTQTLQNKTLNRPTITGQINYVDNAQSFSIVLPRAEGQLMVATAINSSISSAVSTASTTLTSQITAQKERIDRLLTYLENWINVGNLSMADIKSTVDPSV